MLKPSQIKSLECNRGCKLESIAGYVFGYTDTLEYIKTANNLTSLSPYTFADPENLTEIDLSKSKKLTEIPHACFQWSPNESNLQKVILPDSISSIGSDAFTYNSELTSVHMPANLQIIEDGAFAQCQNLGSIEIPDSVTFIGNSAFIGCNRLSGITLPPQLTAIARQTFNRCHCLSNVNVPDSVISVGSLAFYNCRDLSTISLGQNVDTINANAFGGGNADRSSVHYASLTSLTAPSFTVQQVTENAQTWNIPSGCIVHCKDGDITV